MIIVPVLLLGFRHFHCPNIDDIFNCSKSSLDLIGISNRFIYIKQKYLQI